MNIFHTFLTKYFVIVSLVKNLAWSIQNCLENDFTGKQQNVKNWTNTLRTQSACFCCRRRWWRFVLLHFETHVKKKTTNLSIHNRVSVRIFRRRWHFPEMMDCRRKNNFFATIFITILTSKNSFFHKIYSSRNKFASHTHFSPIWLYFAASKIALSRVRAPLRKNLSIFRLSGTTSTHVWGGRGWRRAPTLARNMRRQGVGRRAHLLTLMYICRPTTYSLGSTHLLCTFVPLSLPFWHHQHTRSPSRYFVHCGLFLSLSLTWCLELRRHFNRVRERKSDW